MLSNTIKIIREKVREPVIQNKKATFSQDLICVNGIPIKKYQEKPNTAVDEDTKFLYKSALIEYLKSYTDIEDFLDSENTVATKEMKETVAKAVENVYSAENKHKCLYDLRKAYEEKRWDTSYTGEKITYAYGYKLQLFKNDLTVIFKTTFKAHDYCYLYPLEDITEVNEDIIYYDHNPNIMPASQLIERSYRNSFMNQIEEFNDEIWEDYSDGSNYANLKMYLAYSINTELYTRCCNMRCLNPSEATLTGYGLTDADYTKFLCQSFLANIELSEYFQSRKYRTARNTYAPENMTEYLPIIYDTNSSANLLCLKLAESQDESLMDILCRDVFPTQKIYNMDISFIIKSNLTEGINNKTLNSGYSYFLTRGEIFTLTGVAYTEVYSYTINAINMTAVLIQLIPQQYRDRIQEVLTAIQNVYAVFKKDYSDFYLTAIKPAERIPGYFAISYPMTANFLLYKRMYPEELIQNEEIKESTEKILSTLQRQGIINIILMRQKVGNPQKTLTEIQNIFNKVTCQEL